MLYLSKMYMIKSDTDTDVGEVGLRQSPGSGGRQAGRQFLNLYSNTFPIREGFNVDFSRSFSPSLKIIFSTVAVASPSIYPSIYLSIYFLPKKPKKKKHTHPLAYHESTALRIDH